MTVAQVSPLIAKLFRRLRGIPKYAPRIEALYKQKPYLDAYSKHIDIRVEDDPHEAVGGAWEEIGGLQFGFLVENGLEPHHKLLDIGCGTLRGGRHFVRYLDVGHYTGIDISPKAIAYCKQLIEQEKIAHKQPRLLVSRNKNLRFKEFDGETFDFLLAQSVFTHLKPEHIDECFRHIARIMGEDSVFFFTFHNARRSRQTRVNDFRYPFSFFRSVATQYGFTLVDRSGDYKHPRGQHMAMLS